MLILVIAVSMALLVSFLCSIMEAVLLSIGNTEVAALDREGKRAGHYLKAFKRNIDVPIAAILIVNTVAHTVGATVAGASYREAINAETLWLFSILFTVSVLLFTEIIPKTLGVTYARELASPVAYSIRFLTVLLKPLVRASERISRALRKNKTVPITSQDEIRLLAILGQNEGVVGPRTAGIIVRATYLNRLTAQDVMVPKPQVVFLSAERTQAENFAVIRKSGHSRIPFSSTDDLNQIEGIVLVKELFFRLQDTPNEPLDWKSLLREPLIVPESQRLSSLLRTFQEARSHLAIVVDEYGIVAGIVTLEDVLEELVGDIFDESDREIEDMWPQADGSLIVLATADIRKVSEYLGLEWQAGTDFKSIGGLVTELLERLPTKGDAVEWHNYRLEVDAATRTRAMRIRIKPIAANEMPAGTVLKTEK